MFARSTSQDHSVSNSRRKWTIGAWVMGILFLTVATPALANDSCQPKSGGYRQVQKGGHYHRNTNYRSRTERQFDRGLKAGIMDGQRDGFKDGKFGHGYHPKPDFGCSNRSKYFQKGYRRGYRKAYEEAFHRGQHQRARVRQQRRRRWAWRIDW